MSPREVPVLSPDEAMAHEGLTFVDVREPEEYALGHIPGSLNWPLESFLESLETDKSSFDLKGLGQGTEIVCVCRSGRRSDKAASAMLDAGWTEVYNLKGGMLAFAASGHTVER
ncbi:MAG: rhodanese-like domain-containing protein [Fimbriimonadaceae bacterium]|nr:rhodanese-like domain-containing protein [Fimbriimonadaceae bacterium]QYK56323.1 MAG: rhodanese-like domain-containing protein [Fimbriimonadaceae bacterium]